MQLEEAAVQEDAEELARSSVKWRDAQVGFTILAATCAALMWVLPRVAGGAFVVGLVGLAAMSHLWHSKGELMFR